jgi:uncharacterized protein (TIGR03067 family)
MRYAAALLLALSAATAAPLPFPRDRTQADLMAMQGEWEMACTYWVHATADGKPVKAAAGRCRVTIHGDRLTFRPEGGDTNAFSVRLDGSRSPGWIDAVRLPGGGRDDFLRRSDRWAGVYRLKGETLWISDADSREGGRPTRITGDHPFRLIVLRRVKK